MIFSLFNWIWPRVQDAQPEEIKSVAKKRLQLLLVHDRVQLTAPQMDALKRDLYEVLNRYVEIDPDELAIELQQLPDSRKMALVSNIPVKRVLEPGADDPNISTPSFVE